MSMPLDQQPPPMTVPQQSYSTHSTHGSVGPVIAVLVVIIILSILAVMIGRLCSGRTIMGYGQYDIESWAELKCTSCIDGRIHLPPQPPPATRSDAPNSSASAQTQQDTKQDDQSPSNTSANADS